MSQLNLKIFLLSLTLTIILVAVDSALDGSLFFLGATLAMLSVTAYSDIAGLMLGTGGGFLVPGLALVLKLGVVIAVLTELHGSNMQGLLPFILGLLSFVPAVLLPYPVVPKEEQDRSR
jgi:hypothetical protein